jgi:hypothetical protein
MGFLQYENILKLCISKCGLNGLNEKKMVLEVNEVLAKHEFNMFNLLHMSKMKGVISQP